MKRTNRGAFMVNQAALILLSFLFLIGCATTKKAVPGGGAGEKVVSGIVEDFDPMSLTDDDFTIPPKQAATADTAVSETPAGKAEKSPGQTGEAEKKYIEVPGYRIQIAAVSSQEDAAEIKREAMLKFDDVNVYLTFEPPYYKIRIGDFEKRHDAEEYQRKAVAAGYKDAWIVRTIIVKEVQNH